MANHPRRNENRSRIGPVLYAPREREGERCSPRQSGPADSTIPCHIKETGSQFCCSRRPGALLCWPPWRKPLIKPFMFPNTSCPDARGRSRASALLASLALAMALLLSGAWSAAAHAATPGTPAEIEADLASARKQIDDMRKRIANEADDANLQQLYGTAVDIQAKAEAAAETLAPQLASVAARLNELGAPRKAARKRRRRRPAPEPGNQPARAGRTDQARQAAVRGRGTDRRAGIGAAAHAVQGPPGRAPRRLPVRTVLERIQGRASARPGTPQHAARRSL